MNRIAILSTLLAAIALSACATVTDGLKSLNDATRPKGASSAQQAPAPTAPMSRTEQLLFSNGQPAQLVTIGIPGKPCDPERYVVDWKRNYVNAWNDVIRTKQSGYAVPLKGPDKKAYQDLSAQRLQLPAALPLRTLDEEKRVNSAFAGCSTVYENGADGTVRGTNDANSRFGQ